MSERDSRNVLRCRCGEPFEKHEYERWSAHTCPWVDYANEHGEWPGEEWEPEEEEDEGK